MINLIGWEGVYTIDKLGNIFDIVKNKNIKHYNHNHGYVNVTLRGRGLKNRVHLLHRLIAIHFIPNPKNLPTVNHIDGDKKNNSIENLEWCTYAENNEHATRTGLNKHIGHLKRDDHPLAKLTQKKANRIRELKKEGIFSTKEISIIYQVSDSAINNLLKNRTWQVC